MADEFKHQKEFLTKLNAHWCKQLNVAGILLSNQVKQELGKVSPPASSPGEPPGLRTGELRRSIAWEVDGESLKCRVGSNKSYSKYLEMGTSKMDARPYLKPVVEANQGVIASILHKPMS